MPLYYWWNAALGENARRVYPAEGEDHAHWMADTLRSDPARPRRVCVERRAAHIARVTVWNWYVIAWDIPEGARYR